MKKDNKIVRNQGNVMKKRECDFSLFLKKVMLYLGLVKMLLFCSSCLDSICCDDGFEPFPDYGDYFFYNITEFDIPVTSPARISYESQEFILTKEDESIILDALKKTQLVNPFPNRSLPVGPSVSLQIYVGEIRKTYENKGIYAGGHGMGCLLDRRHYSLSESMLRSDYPIDTPEYKIKQVVMKYVGKLLPKT